MRSNKVKRELKYTNSLLAWLIIIFLVEIKVKYQAFAESIVNIIINCSHLPTIETQVQTILLCSLTSDIWNIL